MSRPWFCSALRGVPARRRTVIWWGRDQGRDRHSDEEMAHTSRMVGFLACHVKATSWMKPWSAVERVNGRRQGAHAGIVGTGAAGCGRDGHSRDGCAEPQTGEPCSPRCSCSRGILFTGSIAASRSSPRVCARSLRSTSWRSRTNLPRSFRSLWCLNPRSSRSSRKAARTSPSR